MQTLEAEMKPASVTHPHPRVPTPYKLLHSDQGFIVG